MDGPAEAGSSRLGSLFALAYRGSRRVDLDSGFVQSEVAPLELSPAEVAPFVTTWVAKVIAALTRYD